MGGLARSVGGQLGHPQFQDRGAQTALARHCRDRPRMARAPHVRRIGEGDFVHVDVSPRRVVVVDDLQRRLLPEKLPDVPNLRLEQFAILPGSFTNFPTLHAQGDSGFLRRNAPTQKKADVGVVDLERR